MLTRIIIWLLALFSTSYIGTIIDLAVIGEATNQVLEGVHVLKSARDQLTSPLHTENRLIFSHIYDGGLLRQVKIRGP